jgi:hypothetical protein
MFKRVTSLRFLYLLACIILAACAHPIEQAIIPTVLPSGTPLPTAIPPVAYLAPQSSITPIPYIGPSIIKPFYPGPQPDKPMLILSPTPVMHWNREVIEVSWKFVDAFIEPGWRSSTIAQVANYPGGPILVDISAGKGAKAVVAPTIPGWISFSPRNTYAIECRNEMRMIRVKDSRLISETSLLTPDFSWGGYCWQYIQWAPNESFVSFIASDNNLYVWSNNGTQPKQIMDHLGTVFPRWSPDAQKFALVTYKSDPNDTYIGIVTLIDKDGWFLNKFQVKAGAEYYGVGWFTENVLASQSKYSTWYYDARSGQLLFTWNDYPPANGIFHQCPQASPDGRWVFIDQDAELPESASDPFHPIIQKEYSLYDVRNKSRTILLDHLGTYLNFVGWNNGSSKLYVLSRPAEPGSIGDPSTPFGLLAYDINTRQFELLFNDAVQVAWNADKNWAYVVYAARDEKGNLRLAGVLWKVGSQTMIGGWQISSQMIFRDPATDTFLNAYPGPYSIAWSHDGQKVVVCNESGHIKFINTIGEEIMLTEDINPREVAMSWSPDDQHLLVEQENRAWIVSMSGL